ncbi:MFS transporter [Amycolatopsis orientalis]|nr:MFS transporter [Amycolatopsis orientalis]
MLVALLTAMIVLPISQTSLLPLLPSLARDFGVSAADINWLMIANLVASAVLTPLLGRLGDLYGHKRLLLLALLGPVAGSLLAALTHSFALLVLARVLQGATAGVFPLAVGIIRTHLPQPARGMALISTSMGVGSGLGVLAGSVLMTGWGYQAIFWLLFALSLAALLAVARVVPTDRVAGHVRGVDLLGALTLVSWLCALLTAISKGNTWGWSDTRILGLMLLTAIGLGAWITVERRVRHPLVDLTMLTRRTVALTGIAATLTGFGMYGSLIMVSEFVQTPREAGFGFSASVLGAGLMLLPSSLGNLAAAPLGLKIGPRRCLIMGGVVSAVAMLLVITGHDYSIAIYLASAFIGLGTGLAFSAMPTCINMAVPADQTGIANSMNVVFRTIGSATASAVMGAILVSSHTLHVIPTLGAYQAAFLLTTLGFLAAGLIPLAITGSTPPNWEGVVGRSDS